MSLLKSPKPKICKCGHERPEHVHGILKSLGDCNLCPCTDYFRKNQNSKLLVAGAGIGIFMLSAFCLSVIPLVILGFETNAWDVKVELPYWVVTFLVTISLGVLIIPNALAMIKDRSTAVNRKEW